jgi:hypothetical protein
MVDKQGDVPEVARSISRQAWIALAVWMSFGLLFEGLIGFRSPYFLQDPLRRELWRLAHAHGTVLSILLLVVGLYLYRALIEPPLFALWALRLGTVLMPVGFLLGGIGHYESDPSFAVVLAPLGGVMIIFGVVAIALSRGR